ncbi:AAA family ATPase [Ramlibacter albus]|uniref:AAA family ATPase n=1 Tax=Ramlibacter albus TaxID=2079448 RepID=A0A923S8L4_9BURK|nr:ATP-binding protein [Ramlibacter albus]MBC5768217.1 AAA family ATPase [Ramlibacter albus]
MAATADEFHEIEKDLASLARLAAGDAHEDVRLLLARFVRKYRQKRPDLAAQLDQALKSSQTRGAGGALRRADSPSAPAFSPPPVDSDSRLALIREFDDRRGLEPPLLSASVHRQIESIVLERLESDRLAAKGITPTRSAILVGPPGVGKTLSARWIAARLRKPLWVLDLTAVMSSLLGKTGNNLRAALDHAKANSAVLLLDEIDAIAKRRSDESDIGELKRLVTVILQEVDQWPATGLLLAATNHPELVDPALWRRFEAVVQFGKSEPAAVSAAVRRFLGEDLATFEPWVDALSSTLADASLSDVQRSITALRRRHALNEADAQLLVGQLLGDGMASLSKAQRLALAIDLAKSGQHTHQDVSKLTGVARDTIRRHAGPSPRRGRGLK